MEERAAVPDERGDVQGAVRANVVVRGTVVHGDGRGRQLGYPTANVAVAPGETLPADGVYAGTYERPDGSRHPALISLGRRPTFYGCGQRVLEVHLLDCDDSLYGEDSAVTFLTWLRSQQHFDSPAGLARQIRHDLTAARGALAAGGSTFVRTRTHGPA
jgi:riboflavin kinase / FMN adenylyltransferase